MKYTEEEQRITLERFRRDCEPKKPANLPQSVWNRAKSETGSPQSIITITKEEHKQMYGTAWSRFKDSIKWLI